MQDFEAVVLSVQSEKQPLWLSVLNPPVLSQQFGYRLFLWRLEGGWREQTGVLSEMGSKESLLSRPPEPPHQILRCFVKHVHGTKLPIPTATKAWDFCTLITGM